MKQILIAALVLFQLSGLNSVLVCAEVPIPKSSARIIDQTSTLTREQLSSLEFQLAELQKEKGSQLVVLILPSTQPEDIAQFGIRLADNWKIGRANADDGVILIIAKEDRAVRIEVGRGLEGAIPDVVSKRIIEGEILPQFRSGNFFEGIQSAVNSLSALIRGEILPEATGSLTESQSLEGFGPIFILGVAIASLLATLGLRSSLAGSIAAIGSGIVALVASMPWWIAFILVIAVFVISLGAGSGGGYSRRRGSANSWGGWSGGSGGWSGGGAGSFGGGGASGRW